IEWQMSNPERPSMQSRPEVVGDHLVIPRSWPRKATSDEVLAGVTDPRAGWDQWQSGVLVFSQSTSKTVLLYLQEHLGPSLDRFADSMSHVPWGVMQTLGDALFRSR